MLSKAVRMPIARVIIAGPTGAQKKQRLQVVWTLWIISQKFSLSKIQDPVEKIITLATQVPVNTEHYNRSFASMTRTVLRMDIDVIVFGEIWDEDTTNIMIRAAIIGHLIFWIVHTNTSPNIITRLTDFGLSPSLLSSPNLLVCLICQRLVPLLCSQCATFVSESASHQKTPYSMENGFWLRFLCT